MNGDIILSSKFFLKILFIFNELILLSAALGPRCCVGAFSNCGECGLLSSCGVRASHCQPSLLLWGVRASVAMSPGPRAEPHAQGVSHKDVRYRETVSTHHA